jgi:protein SCO1/2
MKAMLMALIVALIPLVSHAEIKQAPAAGGETVVEKSENGGVIVEMTLPGSGIAVGENSLNLMVRNKDGSPVTGAGVTVTPWMPDMGHGVFQKPLIIELGAGMYRVEKIYFIMPGRWQLRVDLKAGEKSERVLFDFPGIKKREKKGTKESAYERSIENYRVPAVSLMNQDRKMVSLDEYLDPGKTVVLDFIFSTCTTICPIYGALYTDFQKKLGEDRDDVQLISISIDPEYDTPEKMKEFLANYGAKEGWDYFTGTKKDVEAVMKAFDAYVPNKMRHYPLTFIRPKGKQMWIRILGLIGGSDLLLEYGKLTDR